MAAFPSRRRREPPGPLDAAGLEALALRYVERFQTTRARVVRYLSGKLRQRGWAEEAGPDLEALAERLVARGYIDEAAFGEAKRRGMKARGLGPRRIRDRLRADGVEAAEAMDEDEALALALAFARRRKFGPFGPGVDARGRARQFAALLRAGHSAATAATVLGAAFDESPMEEG